LKEELRQQIRKAQEAMQSLQAILPSAGQKPQETVAEAMNELISEDYEPYFSGNAALHLVSRCRRCGRCCREELTVAVSFHDCKRIAKHKGMSLKRFMKDYTLPHELKGEAVGNARMIRKETGEPCPFYDSTLPGCSIQSVKPQVCSAALYLSKMNLLLCEENRKFSTFSNCPADVELRERMANFSRELKGEQTQEPTVKETLDGWPADLPAELFQSSPQADLFRLLLRLKGMEKYFGRDAALPLAQKMGLKRLPEDDELKPLAFLFAAMLLEKEAANRLQPKNSTAAIDQLRK
jgi:Fe-S-cluster containining protein